MNFEETVKKHYRRPVELLVGPIGAQRVECINGEHAIVCRYAFRQPAVERALYVDEATAQKAREWIAQDKPGLIQNVFPELTPSQREMIMTGMNDEEWEKLE